MMLKHVIKYLVPPTVYRPILTWWRRLQPIRWDSLRWLSPVSRVFGFDLGLCIDRYYIEEFLRRSAPTFRTRDWRLEIGDRGYTRKFGGDRVTHSDVLHAVSGNSEATLIGDLVTSEGAPIEVFDCMILTQTLLFIYDVQVALATCYRALQPGGGVLVTFPGIFQISRYKMDRWGDYWRFTDASARRLFENVFGRENITVVTYGNVLPACAFLHGLAAQELKREELDYRDPDYTRSSLVCALSNGK